MVVGMVVEYHGMVGTSTSVGVWWYGGGTSTTNHDNMVTIPCIQYHTYGGMVPYHIVWRQAASQTRQCHAPHD